MPDGSGGFTVDAFGGLHWFSIGASHVRPRCSARRVPGNDGPGHHDPPGRHRRVRRRQDRSAPLVLDRDASGKAGGERRACPASHERARGVAVLTRLISKAVAPVDPRMPLVGEYVEDVVVDTTGHYAYATRNAGSIEVLDLDTRTQVASIPVGKNPTGLRADTRRHQALRRRQRRPRSGTAPGSIAIIDVATRQVTSSLTLPTTSRPSTRRCRSRSSPTGRHSSRRLTLRQEAAAVRARPGHQHVHPPDRARRRLLALSGYGQLSVSGDRMHAGIAAQRTAAVTTVYNVASDTFVTRTVLGQHFLEMDEDGNRILLDGTWIYNSNLSRLGTIQDGSSYHGILCPDGTIAYRAGSRLLQKVDVATHTVTTSKTCTTTSTTAAATSRWPATARGSSSSPTTGLRSSTSRPAPAPDCRARRLGLRNRLGRVPTGSGPGPTRCGARGRCPRRRRGSRPRRCRRATSGSRSR